MSTQSWTSAANGDWTNANDWSNHLVPNGGSVVAISVPGTYTLTILSGTIAAASAISVTDAGATLRDAGTLDLGGTLAISSGSFVLLSSGTVSGGTIQTAGSGSFVVSGGTLDAVTVDGSFAVASNATLFISGGIGFAGADGTGSATVDLIDNSSLIIYGTTRLDNVTIELGGGDSILSYDATSAATLTFGAAATLDTSGYYYDQIEGTGDQTLINSGTIAAGGGELLIDNFAQITNAGDITVSGGVSVEVVYAGNFTNTGNITVDQGFLIFNNSAVVNSGSITIHSGGDVEIAQSSSLANGGTFSVASGGLLELHNSVTPALLATLTVAAGGTVEIDYGGVLLNAGHVVSAGSGTFELGSNGTISGGTIDGDALLVSGGSLDAVTVDGTLTAGPYVTFAVSGGISFAGSNGTGSGSLDLTGPSAEVRISGTTALDNVTIELDGGAGYAYLVSDDATSAATLTLGATASVDLAGYSAEITGAGDGTLINSGTVSDSAEYAYLTSFADIKNVGDITVNSGALYVQQAALTNAGTITVSAGAYLVISGSLTNNGTIAIDGGTLDLVSATHDTGTIDFVGSGGTLQIDTATMPGDTLKGFAPGDSIDLTAVAYDASGTVTLAAHNVLEITENGATYDLQLDPSANYGGDSFQASAGSSGTEITVTSGTTPCYCRGTRIMAERGEIAVEDLRVGDRVLTLSGLGPPLAPIVWIGSARFDARRHPRPEQVLPVRIRRGALGEGMPQRDLLVSPGHSLAFDTMLVQAETLINGATILRDTAVTCGEYFHVELAHHDLLLAERVAAESYLDTGNRHQFAGGAAFATLHPDFSLQAGEATCLPLMREGDALRAVQRRLLARAHALGFATTDDRGLGLRVDGRWIAPAAVEGDEVLFRPPAGAQHIRLCSRTWVPAEFDPACEDHRVLGVCVEGLWVDGRRQMLAWAQFGDDWHECEAGDGTQWRWTRGAALLPSGTEIRIRLRGERRYWAHQRQAA